MDVGRITSGSRIGAFIEWRFTPSGTVDDRPSFHTGGVDLLLANRFYF